MASHTAVSPAGLPGSSPGSYRQRTFLGHPVGLYVLFFTEMWERFSYYGMRGLLVLYMLHWFYMTQEEASRVYKWYTALVYFTPLIGGYLADRFLGNRLAVIIGAVLMAIGHFLMAWPTYGVFCAALIFLIIGNGFFKPNMSTQVGRLYAENDPRLDGAYTIFYMGINLGAFLSPLVCGWLAENTVGQWHSGFAAAGIGMVIGLFTYLLGQPFVREVNLAGKAGLDPTESGTSKTAIPLPHPVAGSPQGNQGPNGNAPPKEEKVPISEAQAERTTSALPFMNRLSPGFLVVIGCLLAIVAVQVGPTLKIVSLGGVAIKLPLGLISWDNVAALEIAAICSFISAWITSRVHQAVRDRVLAIYILGIFVVFFWAAYEQAGNVLNLWADKATDRVLTGPPALPSEYPETEPELEAADKDMGPWQRLTSMFHLLPPKKAEEKAKVKEEQGYTIPTTWFQSINAIAIFVLAPLFAILWTTLERSRFNPSIATKMAFGVVLMGLSLAVMIGAARKEDQPTSVPFQGQKLPEALGVNPARQLAPRNPETKELGQPYHAGRLLYEPQQHSLEANGVLSDLERNEIVRDTAPAPFTDKVKELQKQSQAAPPENVHVAVHLDQVPAGFDLGYAGLSDSKVHYDPATQTLSARSRLEGRDIKALLVAGGDPNLRDTLNHLMQKSSVYRVSPWWLFWSYILATLGELCLSPVGLAMVSKLAPARFATMLMGMWLLTSFFGNFVAGAIGERYESVTPTTFFLVFSVALAGVSVVLFLLVRKITRLMHGVS